MYRENCGRLSESKSESGRGRGRLGGQKRERRETFDFDKFIETNVYVSKG